MRSAAFVALAALLSGCGSGTYTWGWFVVSPFDSRGVKNLRFLTDGLGATLSISLMAIVLAVLPR